MEKNNRLINIEYKDKTSLNYVILDAALWEHNMQIAFDLCPVYTSLFATRGAENNLDIVAPFLFSYTGNSEFSNWLKRKEEKGFRALYISSEEAMEGIRKHIRRFLRVKTEDGRWLFFRIYDPTVLPYTLPNLTCEQLQEFFSVINYIKLSKDAFGEEKSFYLLNNELKINIL